MLSIEQQRQDACRACKMFDAAKGSCEYLNRRSMQPLWQMQIAKPSQCKNFLLDSDVIRLPTWVRLIRMLRKTSDVGIGDTVQRVAAKFGGERFKAWAKRIGLPCGCTERQAEWNLLYPYSPLPASITDQTCTATPGTTSSK